MACLGCGAVSQNRLCCPECIKYGRTSFFCGQECFTKNWKSHSQLHEVLRRQASEGGSGATAGATASSSAPADGLGSSSASTQGIASRATPQPRRGTAPLPGGMPLVNSRRPYPSSSESAAAKKDGPPGAAGQAGKLGGIMGQALAKLGSAATGAISGATSSGRSSADDDKNGSLRERGRSRSRSTERQGPKPGSGAVGPVGGRRTRLVKMSVAILTLVGMVGVGLLHSVHQQHLEDQRRDKIALEAGVEIMNLVPGMEPAPEATAAPEVVAEPAAGAAHSSQEPTVESLQSQLQKVRHDLERHEKMLRYVMERYVEKEKTVKEPATEGKMLETHKAGEAPPAAPSAPAGVGEAAPAGSVGAVGVAVGAAVAAAPGDATDLQESRHRRGSRGGRGKKVGIALPEVRPEDSREDAADENSFAADSLNGDNPRPGVASAPAGVGAVPPVSPSDNLQLRGGGPEPLIRS